MLTKLDAILAKPDKKLVSPVIKLLIHMVARRLMDDEEEELRAEVVNVLIESRVLRNAKSVNVGCVMHFVTSEFASIAPESVYNELRSVILGDVNAPSLHPQSCLEEQLAGCVSLLRKYLSLHQDMRLKEKRTLFEKEASNIYKEILGEVQATTSSLRLLWSKVDLARSDLLDMATSDITRLSTMISQLRSAVSTILPETTSMHARQVVLRAWCNNSFVFTVVYKVLIASKTYIDGPFDNQLVVGLKGEMRALTNIAIELHPIMQGLVSDCKSDGGVGLVECFLTQDANCG
jgi:hypothetical protein